MSIYANEYNNNAGERRDKIDVRDLTRIAIEDGIAANEIVVYFHIFIKSNIRFYQATFGL
jgi:hypothetical protein